MRRRPPLALPLALALLAGCDRPAAECPGDEVAPFRFQGKKVTAGDPSLAGLDPDPTVPDCVAEVGYPSDLASFPGTLSAGPSPQAAALCRNDARVMFGQRAGDRFVVETSTEGAVLKDCAGCPARLRLVVAGDVLPGGTAPATGFDGALVEILGPADGDCGPCTLPCAGRYHLTGAVP